MEADCWAPGGRQAERPAAATANIDHLEAEDRTTTFGQIEIVGPRGRFEDYVTNALEAVPDAVGINDLGLKIRHNPALTPFGVFYTASCLVEIRVKDTPTPGLTVLHEIGHALDWIRFGGCRAFGSDDGDVRLSPVMSAIVETRLSGELVQDLELARYLQRQSASELSRMLEPRELFARAFAQWAVTEAHDDLMRRELAIRQQIAKRAEVDEWKEPRYRDHWTDADFAPVRDAFSRLFS